jgi:hypothetical protein
MTKRTDDYDEIVRVIHLYLDAANENDLNKLKEALDENAWMFFIDADGALHKGVMREMFEEGLRNGGLRKYLGDVVGRHISDAGGRCCLRTAQLRLCHRQVP